MKADYWNVSDSQAFEKTGKHLAEWKKILDEAQAGDRKSNDIVAFLQKEHGVQRYWARTITTWHIKQGA